MSILIKIISPFVAIYIIFAIFGLLVGIVNTISFSFEKYRVSRKVPFTFKEFMNEVTNDRLFCLVSWPLHICKAPKYLKDVKDFIFSIISKM